jgi:hypothetical protein
MYTNPCIGDKQKSPYVIILYADAQGKHETAPLRFHACLLDLITDQEFLHAESPCQGLEGRVYIFSGIHKTQE